MVLIFPPDGAVDDECWVARPRSSSVFRLIRRHWLAMAAAILYYFRFWVSSMQRSYINQLAFKDLTTCIDLRDNNLFYKFYKFVLVTKIAIDHTMQHLFHNSHVNVLNKSGISIARSIVMLGLLGNSKMKHWLHEMDSILVAPPSVGLTAVSSVVPSAQKNTMSF